MPEASLYDPIRKRVQSQFSQSKQQGQDALKRRFAANGMLSSGAYAKQATMADEKANEQQAQALGEVDFAEASDKSQKEFAKSEREASQGFAKGEREAGQKFQSDFTRGEREAGQSFQKSLYDLDMAFKEKVFNSENNWRKMEFDESKYANYINALTALKNAEIEPGMDTFNAQEQYANLRTRFGA